MYDPAKHNPILQQVADEEGIPAHVLYGLMMTESGGRPRQGPATDNFGKPLKSRADGYFQFLPATAKEQGVKVGDFESEARGAARYLNQLGKGDLNVALAKYGGHVKADPTPYIGKVLGKGAEWQYANTPEKSLVTGKPLGDLTAEEASEMLLRGEQDAVVTQRNLMQPDYDELRKLITTGDELSAIGLSILSGIAGGVVGSPAGPAGVAAGGVAGGAAGAGIGKYIMARDRIREARPDLSDEQILEFARHEGLVDAGMDAAIGTSLLGLGKAWDAMKMYRLGRKIGASGPAGKELATLHGDKATAPIDAWIAQSGKKPGFAGKGLGSGAGVPIYRDAGHSMRDFLEGTVQNLSQSYGDIGKISEAFLEARSVASDTIKAVVDPVYKKYATDGVMNKLRIGVDRSTIDPIIRAGRDKAEQGVGLIDASTSKILEKLAEPTLTAGELMNIRRSVDNLLDFEKGGEVSGDAKKFILKPLREALNKNLDDGLRARGYPASANELLEANAKYSGFMKAVDSDLMIKIAEKDPNAVAKYLAQNAGEYGMKSVDEAIAEIRKYNPRFTRQAEVKFKDLVRNAYTRQFAHSPEKLADLGANLAAKGKADPDAYKTFRAMFKGKSADEALFARTAIAMGRVRDWSKSVDNALQMGSNPGSVAAAIGFGNAVGGRAGGLAGAMAVNLALAGLPRAAARAAVEGNNKMRVSIMGAAARIARLESVGELLEPGVQKMLNEIVEYGEGMPDE